MKKWAYLILKGLFSLVMVASALGKLSQSEQLVTTFDHLGYPTYLLTVLGVAYLLGVAGIFQPWVPTLREWAYAGFAFALIGAFLSHLLSGDPILQSSTTLVLVIIMFVAYYLEKQVQAPAALDRSKLSIEY